MTGTRIEVTITEVATSAVAAGAIGANCGAMPAIIAGVAAANEAVGQNQRDTRNHYHQQAQQNAQQPGMGNYRQIDGIAQREGKERDQRLYRAGEKFPQRRVQIAQRLC